MSDVERDVMVSQTAFSKMCNLRFLKIYCRHNVGHNKYKLYSPQGLDSFVSKELKYFQWDFCPSKSLPSDFTSENLVELILRHSQLKQLGSPGIFLISLYIFDVLLFLLVFLITITLYVSS